jgi:hypothetical protein
MNTANPFKPDRLKRLTKLEAENARLREMAANLTAHVRSLKAAISGAPGDRRDYRAAATGRHLLPITRTSA